MIDESVKWLKIPNDYNEMCRCGESDSVRFITGSVGLKGNTSNLSYHTLYCFVVDFLRRNDNSGGSSSIGQ